MPTLKLTDIRIKATHGDGELQCHFGELVAQATWLERWALSFVYRLIDNVYRAGYKVAEDLERK